MSGIVVVGGGHAGAALVAALRSEGYDGPLRLVSAESDLPYQKPPLSKAFLKDPAVEPQEIRPAAYYEANRITVDLGRTVTAIDRAGRTLALADGGTIAYDGLALCLGARVRRPAVPGADLAGIFYLRTIDDARAVRAAMGAAARVVVVGGGFIGLEAAATAAYLGHQVTVLEAGDRLMGRAIAPEVSAFMLDKHRAAGLDVRLATALAAFEGTDGRVTGVVATDGSTIPADMVLVGIGVVPNTELAAAAGLAVDNGLVVDEAMRTADPAIVAAGDGVAFPLAGSSGRMIRLESVQNAHDQARHAAMALVGKPTPYTAVPWFWSDQGTTKLQMVGLSTGSDTRVLRGDPASGRFSVFHYREDRLIAIDSVDKPADHMLGRRLLAAGTILPPDVAADEAVDLKRLLAG